MHTNKKLLHALGIFWFYGTVACRIFIDDPKVDTKERWALENVNEKTRICHACYDTYSDVKGSLDLVSAEGAQLSFRPATDVCFYYIVSYDRFDFLGGQMHIAMSPSQAKNKMLGAYD